jgi:hypothetical protein
MRFPRFAEPSIEWTSSSGIVRWRVVFANEALLTRLAGPSLRECRTKGRSNAGTSVWSRCNALRSPTKSWQQS